MTHTVFQFPPVKEDSRTLAQSVLQIISLLDMFQAELARVLEVKCDFTGGYTNE